MLPGALVTNSATDSLYRDGTKSAPPQGDEKNEHNACKPSSHPAILRVTDISGRKRRISGHIWPEKTHFRQHQRKSIMETKAATPISAEPIRKGFCKRELAWWIWLLTERSKKLWTAALRPISRRLRWAARAHSTVRRAVWPSIWDAWTAANFRSRPRPPWRARRTLRSWWNYTGLRCCGMWRLPRTPRMP